MKCEFFKTVQSRLVRATFLGGDETFFSIHCKVTFLDYQK